MTARICDLAGIYAAGAFFCRGLAPFAIHVHLYTLTLRKWTNDALVMECAYPAGYRDTDGDRRGAVA